MEISNIVPSMGWIDVLKRVEQFHEVYSYEAVRSLWGKDLADRFWDEYGLGHLSEVITSIKKADGALALLHQLRSIYDRAPSRELMKSGMIISNFTVVTADESLGEGGMIDMNMISKDGVCYVARGHVGLCPPSHPTEWSDVFIRDGSVNGQRFNGSVWVEFSSPVEIVLVNCLPNSEAEAITFV